MAMQNIYNYQKPKMVPTQMKTTQNQSPVYDVKKAEPKADQYLEQKIMTAKPEELTMMLYDGMVKFLKQSILYNDQENIQKTHNTIMRAQAIINELNITLREEYDVSTNLRQMYAYMNSRLIDANLEKETNILEEVLGFAEELRDTWKKAMVLTR